MNSRILNDTPFLVFKEKTEFIVRYTGRGGFDLFIYTPKKYINFMHKRAAELRIITKEPFSDMIYYRNNDPQGWYQLINNLDIVNDTKFDMLKNLFYQRKKYVYLKDTLTSLVHSCFNNNIKISIVLKYDNYVIYNKKNIEKIVKQLRCLLNKHMSKDLSNLVIGYWIALYRHDYN
jgi:hypothetical protein